MAQASDVVCSCTGVEECSDITISFVPSSQGVYLNIQYAYGERDTEGFATVTTHAKLERVIYKLGNFTLLKEKGVYSLPGRPATCS